MIKVSGLNKFYRKGKSNEIHVIDNTTLEFPDTGLVVLLGHSGSGKTTLLNVIGGLDKANGEIEYGSEKLSHYRMNKMDSLRNKYCGYVFQNYNLLLDETVYDNLKIALNLYGVYDKEEIDKRIEYCLKAVKMFNYRKRKAGALSGGQQQRIAIARALIKNPTVIIADEPTGNLDSGNTIEVMNIIKKISEKCLVLLVTHEENIASFYADRIIRIVDGKVESDLENNDSGTLSVKDNQTIYLKDLDKKEVNDGCNLCIYSDNPTIPSVKIDLIFRNGNIFINTDNRNIKFINVNSDVKVIDDHYHDIQKNDLEDFVFDTGFFKKSKKRKFDIKAVGREIRNAFRNFSHVRKLTKFMYAGFILLGMVIAYLVVQISNFNHFDFSDIHMVGDENQVVFYEKELTKEQLQTVLEQDGILKVNSQSYGYDFYTSGSLNYHGFTYIDNLYYGVRDLLVVEQKKLVYGAMPKEDEIVISRSLADKLLEGLKGIGFKSYKELCGLDIYLSYVSSTAKISGVVEGKTLMTYVNHSFLSQKRNDYKNDIYSYNFKKDGKSVYDYTLLSGKEPVNLNEIMIDSSLINNVTLQDGEYYIDYPDGYYKVTGVFTGTPYRAILSLANFNFETRVEDAFLSKELYTTEEYVLMDGRNPQKGECIVPFGLKGDTYKGLQIVGHFVSTTGLMNEAFISASDLSIDEYCITMFGGNNGFYSLNVINAQEFLAKAKEQGIKGELFMDAYVKTTNKQDAENRMALLITILILVGCSIIFTFFMMRSKMIHRIYNIGVYRSLGANRHQIYRLFIWENLMLTTLTSILGYIIMLGLMNYFNSLVSSIAVLFHINMFYVFLGVLGIYATNIFFGLLPIYMLLRKTPSEILSKYDI